MCWTEGLAFASVARMKKAKSKVARRPAKKRKAAPKTVDEYLARVPEPARTTLEKIRAAISTFPQFPQQKFISVGLTLLAGRVTTSLPRRSNLSRLRKRSRRKPGAQRGNWKKRRLGQVWNGTASRRGPRPAPSASEATRRQATLDERTLTRATEPTEDPPRSTDYANAKERSAAGTFPD